MCPQFHAALNSHIAMIDMIIRTYFGVSSGIPGQQSNILSLRKKSEHLCVDNTKLVQKGEGGGNLWFYGFGHFELLLFIIQTFRCQGHIPVLWNVKQTRKKNYRVCRCRNKISTIFGTIWKGMKPWMDATEKVTSLWSQFETLMEFTHSLIFQSKLKRSGKLSSYLY